MKQTYSGFTLVELLVVIAIIGILGSIVMVSLNASRSKAKDIRIMSSVRQIRSVMESDYLNSVYVNIQPRGDGTQVAGINTSGPSFQNILTLIKDIAAQNANSQVSNVSGENVDIFTDGSTVQIGAGSGFTDTGLVIFSTNTTGGLNDYAVYATTTVGYTCVDSLGHVVKPGEGTITTPYIDTVPIDNGRVVCH